MTDHEDRRASLRRFEEAVARCVVSSLDDVTLERMDDAPDARLLHRDGRKIGLEVVSTTDQQYLDAKPRLLEAMVTTRQEIQAQQLASAISIYFELAELGPTLTTAEYRRWTREVPSRVSALLRSRDTGGLGKAQLQAQGIRLIAEIQWRPAQVSEVDLGWRSTRKKGETIVELCLTKKDQKVTCYRARHGSELSEHWLAIAGIGPGTMEDGGFSLLLSRRYQTNYDRVFLVFDNPPGRFIEARDVTPIPHRTHVLNGAVHAED